MNLSGKKMILALVVFSVFGSGSLLLPEAHASTQNYSLSGEHERDLALLVSQASHLDVALKTSTEGLQGAGPVKMGSASIVVCGKETVAVLKKGSIEEEKINSAAKAGVKIIACGLSLTAAGIDPSELNSNIQIVPNGLWEMIRLQNLGALSVDL